MADYKAMYTKLFNAITDAIRNLQAVQIEAEKMYISQEEPNITVLDRPDE